jgi:5-methylcytosine-specific restriction endonuclease McrA
MKRKFTQQHRENISKACKGRKTWSKGKKMSKESLYKNMAWHIRFNVDREWLSQFEDIEKLKFLNRCISKRKDRFEVDTEWYKKYILKFYNNKQFENIYRKWLGSNDDYLRPTIDHINPKANGGNNELNNLQFLTWFENRSKNDMPQVVWNKLKENIKDYLI